MKTIGVLGGLGPQATIDFELRLHRVAQWLVPQQGNQGYPPMVSYFFREPPVILPSNGASAQELPPLNPRLLEAARYLGIQADFLVIPSNGVHFWQAEIEAAAQRPVLSMVDTVLAEVRQRGYRRVGLVDFRPPTLSVYVRPLEQLDLEWLALPDPLRESLTGVMQAVGEGRNGSLEEQQLLDAIVFLREQGSDVIILACSEFPLALSRPLEADLLNPVAFLAEAAVRAALA